MSHHPKPSNDIADILAGTLMVSRKDMRRAIEAALSQAIEQEEREECQIPPLGWRCTREAGHDGPCAAVEAPEDVEFVKKGMERLREATPPRQPWVGLTDEMVTAAARALNDRQAKACGVNKDDHWYLYGDDIKEDARVVLEAAHGIKEQA